MDAERRAKRQSRRIIISEFLMVVTVIVTVLILVLVVSGYWVNADFKVERQGLLQISSFPTGADLLIDGEGAWLQRTNMSKVLPVGEHSLTLSKEGYDTWSKTIEMKEGLLYRISYPRLFLKERESQKVWTLPENAEFVTVSPDQKTLLVATNTLEWQIVNLENEKIEPKVFDVSKVFVGPGNDEMIKVGETSENQSKITSFPGKILSGDWDQDNEHLLLKVQNENKTEWVLLNTRNAALSINLTQEFSADFSTIKILNNSASMLLAVVDGNLRKIDIGGHSMSSVLVTDVQGFDHRNNSVVFAAKITKGSEISKILTEFEIDDLVRFQYYVGSLNLSDGKIEPLFLTEYVPRVLTGRFYDDDYIGVVSRGEVTKFSLDKDDSVSNSGLDFDSSTDSSSGSVENRDTNTDADSSGESPDTVGTLKNLIRVYKKADLDQFFEGEVSFFPTLVTVGFNGDYITMVDGMVVASLDLEATKISEFSLDSTTFSWLGRGMIYNIAESGELVVYDFDGLNRRVLASSVNSNLPAVIARGKWLYYFDLERNLVREEIVK